MKKVLKRFISLIISFALVLPMGTVYVKAEEVTLQDGLTAFSSEEVDSQKAVEAISGVIEHLSDPKSLISWGASELFKEMFKESPMPGQKTEAEQISELLSKMDAALGQLDVIAKEIASTSMVQQINDYKLLDNGDSVTKDCLQRLSDIDSESKSSEEKEEERLKILLYTLTGYAEGSPVQDSANGEYDKKYDKFNSYAQTKFLTVDNEKLYMIEMYDRLLRINEKWYNSYYKAKIGFQNYFVGKYMTVAMIEKMSLLARAQQYEKENPNKQASWLRTRMADIDKDVAAVQKIFNDNKAFEPDNSKRYYMYPGNEKTLWATAKEQIIPTEPNRNKGLSALRSWVEHKKGDAPLLGITMKNIRDLPTYPNLEFWRSFISYEKNCLCPTNDWMKKVYQEYGSQVSLYNIFFDADKGNFTKPSGADSSWLFVVDPDNSLPMKYVKEITEADHLTTPAITSNGVQNYYTIYDYHEFKNEPKTNNRYIGLGITDMTEDDEDDEDDEDNELDEEEDEDNYDFGGHKTHNHDTYQSELPSHSILTMSGSDESTLMDMKVHELDSVTVANQEFLADYYAGQLGMKANILCTFGIYYRNDLQFTETGTKKTLVWNNLSYKTPGPIYAVCYNQTNGTYYMAGVVDETGTAVFNDFIVNEATNVTIFSLK